VFVVLFAGGLIVADLVATTTFPTPTRPADEVVDYFAENRGAVRALATFHAFAALALLVFAAHLSTVLRAASPAGRGLIATLAAAGGAVAAGFLLLDAALFWVLALTKTGRTLRTSRTCHTVGASGVLTSRVPDDRRAWIGRVPAVGPGVHALIEVRRESRVVLGQTP
jgi:hypothetical protein